MSDNAESDNFLAWLVEDVCEVTSETRTPRDETLKFYAGKGFLKFKYSAHGTNHYEITSNWVRDR